MDQGKKHWTWGCTLCAHSSFNTSHALMENKLWAGFLASDYSSRLWTLAHEIVRLRSGCTTPAQRGYCVHMETGASKRINRAGHRAEWRVGRRTKTLELLTWKLCALISSNKHFWGLVAISPIQTLRTQSKKKISLKKKKNFTDKYI